MPVKQVFKGRVPVKVYTNDLDDMAREQLISMTQLPFVHSHIAAMPDAHGGMGAPFFLSTILLCSRKEVLPDSFNTGYRTLRLVSLLRHWWSVLLWGCYPLRCLWYWSHSIPDTIYTIGRTRFRAGVSSHTLTTLNISTGSHCS
jgi:hypothetical protein